MKRLVFLSLTILILGCASVFAQRGGGATGRGGINGGGANPNGGAAGTGRQERPNRSDQTGANAGGGERRAGGRLGGALRGLDLTDEQKQKIRAIQETAKQNGADRKAVAEQIRAVLTPEQVEKFEKRKQEMKEKRKEKKKNQQNQTDGNNSSSPPSNN